jgi:hypothetical protein
MSISYFNILNKIKNNNFKNDNVIIFELENIIIDRNNNINQNLLEIYNYIKKMHISSIIISTKYGNDINICNIKNIIDKNKIPYKLVYFMKEGKYDTQSFKTKVLNSLISQKYNILTVLCEKDESIYKNYTCNCFEINIYEMKNLLYTIIEEDEEDED